MEAGVMIRLHDGRIVSPDGSVCSGSVDSVQSVSDSLHLDSASCSDQILINDHHSEVQNDDGIVYIVQSEGMNLEGVTFEVVEEDSQEMQTIVDANNVEAIVQTVSEIPSCITITPLDATNFENCQVNNHDNERNLFAEIIDETNNTDEKPYDEICEVTFTLYCHYCGRSAGTLKELKEHLLQEHDLDEGVNSSDNEESLIEGGLSVFPTCSICAETFLNENDLKMHENLHEGELKLVKSMSADLDDNNEGKSDNQLAHKCQICPLVFSQRKHLALHVETAHSEVLDKKESDLLYTQCPYCPRLYLKKFQRKSLMKHIKDDHPGCDTITEVDEIVLEKKTNDDFVFPCMHCKKAFRWQKSLLRHIKTHHVDIFIDSGYNINTIDQNMEKSLLKRRSVKEIEELEGESLFVCKECHKVFLWEKSLKRHTLERHSNSSMAKLPKPKKGPRLYKCLFCSLVSRYACSMRKHIERKHVEQCVGLDINRMELPTVDAKFAFEAQIRSVDKRPPEVRLSDCAVVFRCPFCNYASNGQSNLVRHLTSKAHFNIFSLDDLKLIKMSSFKVVKEKSVDENFDGFEKHSNKLPPLKIKDSTLKNLLTEKEKIIQARMMHQERTNNIQKLIRMKSGSGLKSSFFKEKSLDYNSLKYVENNDQCDVELTLDIPDIGDVVEDSNRIQMKKVTGFNMGGVSQHGNGEHTGKLNKTTEINEVADVDNEGKCLEEIKQKLIEPTKKTEMKVIKVTLISSDVKNQTKCTDSHSDCNNKAESIESSAPALTEKCKDKTVDCVVCVQQYTDITALLRHCAEHGNVKVHFKCPECSKDYYIFRQLENHCKIDHEINDISAINCVVLSIIKTSSKPLVTYDCPYCDMLFSKYTSLQQHVQLDHTEHIIKDVPQHCHRRQTMVNANTMLEYKCLFCDYVFTSLLNVVKHVQNIHPDADRSDTKSNSGRKSSRKRQMPKWLEKDTDVGDNAKRAKKACKINSDGNSEHCQNKTRTTSKCISVLYNECELKKTSNLKSHLYSSTMNEAVAKNLKQNKKTRKEMTKDDKKAYSKAAPMLKEDIDSVVEKGKLIVHGKKEKSKNVLICPTDCVTPTVDTRDKMSMNENICPHCPFSAKRASALVFHINFKHINIKIESGEMDVATPTSHSKWVNNAFVKTVIKTDVTESNSRIQQNRAEKQMSVNDLISKNTLSSKKKVKIEQEDLIININGVEDNVKVEKNAIESNGDNIPDLGMDVDESYDEEYIPGKDDRDTSDSELNDTSSVNTLHTCSYCKKKFQSKFQLKNHMLQVHRNCNNVSGNDVCVKETVSNKGDSKQEFYQCTFCKHLLESVSKAHNHIIRIHPDKPDHDGVVKKWEVLQSRLSELETLYRCPHCDFNTRWRRSIVRHIFMVHKNTAGDNNTDLICERIANINAKSLLRCVDSDECFNVKDDINNTTDNNSAKSEVLEDILESDALDEKGTGEFKCPYCECRSNYKRCIKRHIKRRHSDKEEFQSTDIIHNEERQLTTKEMPKTGLFHICPYCELESEWKSSILRHVSRVHPEKKDFNPETIPCHVRTLAKRENAEMCLDDNFMEFKDADFELFKCTYCENIFSSKIEVLEHAEIMHENEEVLSFDDVERVSFDKPPSKDVGAYKCPFCKIESAWQKSIIRHVGRLHPEVKNFKETDVLYEVKSAKKVDQLGAVENYQCRVCNELFMTLNGLARHIKLIHGNIEYIIFDCNKVDNMVNIFKCPFCEQTSTWRKSIVRHVEGCHRDIQNFTVKDVMCQAMSLSSYKKPELGSFSCPYCGIINKWKKSIVRHIRTVHPEQSDNIEIPCFLPENLSGEDKMQFKMGTKEMKCKLCDFQCRSIHSLKKHFTERHPEKLDSYLNKENFELVYSVRSNVLNRTGNQEGTDAPHNCIMCGATYIWMKSLMYHMKTHHADMYDVFVTLTHLVDVVVETEAHSKKALLKCNFCDKEFVARNALLEHVESKHPEYEDNVMLEECTELKGPDNSEFIRECSFCNAKFSTDWSLNVHSRLTHTSNNMPLKTLKTARTCRKCNMMLKNPAAHVRHKLRCVTTKAMAMRCWICDRDFSSLKMYKCHQLVRHNNQQLVCGYSDCKFRCSLKMALQNHFWNIHNIRLPKLKIRLHQEHKCEICSKTFSNQNQLHDHLKLHIQLKLSRKFHCHFCGLTFSSLADRSSHVERAHTDKAEMCDTCGEVFSSSSQFRKHMKKHKLEDSCDGGRMKCTFCGITMTKRSMEKHFLHKHADLIGCNCEICTQATPGESTIQCTYCNLSFCRKYMLYAHNKVEHGGFGYSNVSDIFKCQVCEKVFFTSKMRDLHSHVQHQDQIQSANQTSLLADHLTRFEPIINQHAMDSQPDDSSTSHVIHIGKDEGKQYLPKMSENSFTAVMKELITYDSRSKLPFKCLMCGRCFAKCKYIKLHIRRSHVRDEDQPYRCKVCGSGFVRLTEFRKHSRSHTDFRPYKCKICSKAFKQQSNLREHYHVHNDEKSFQCQICKRFFQQRGGLTSHVVFHDKLKPFTCGICGKGHTTRGELSRHVQKYDKDEKSIKVYTCHICKENFTHFPLLLKHIENHNPEKPFQCLCGERFASFVAMYFHKDKEAHFFESEIHDAMEDSAKKGRKFKITKKSKKYFVNELQEVINDQNHQVNEPLFRNDIEDHEDSETNTVETLMEHYSKEEAAQMPDENKSEHDELLSIAKQLTELSGFTDVETAKRKHVPISNKEEDEIMHSMLDADDDVLASLSRQQTNKTCYTNYNDDITELVVENAEQPASEDHYVTDLNEQTEAGTDYTTFENDVTATNIKSFPTYIEELASLISNRSFTDGGESILAYQSEDGSVLYVCLPEQEFDTNEDTNTDANEHQAKQINITDADVVEVHNNIQDSEEHTESIESYKILTDENIAAGVDVKHIVIDAYENIEDDSHIDHVKYMEQMCVSEQSGVCGNSDANYTINAVSDVGHPLEMSDKDFVTHNKTLSHIAETNNSSREISASYVKESEKFNSQDSAGNLMTETQGATTDGSNYIKSEATAKNEPVFETERPLVEYVNNEGTFIKEEMLDDTFVEVYMSGNMLLRSRKDAPNLNFTFSNAFDCFVCSLCGLKAVSSKSMKNHMKRHAPVNEREFECSYCSKKFVTGNELKRHLSTHTDERNYVCKFCNKRFRQIGHLQEHERLHTGRKPYSCVECNQFFNTRGQVAVHWKRKHSGKKVSCDQCSAEFKTDTDLTRHKGLIHSNRFKQAKKEKPSDLSVGEHVCHICGNVFLKQSMLSLHLKKHETRSDKKFMCHECGVSLKSKEYLSSHIKLKHRDEMTEICEFCGERFKIKQHLRAHIVKLHKTGNTPHKKGEKWTCEICNKIFTSKNSLGYHIGSKHGNT